MKIKHPILLALGTTALVYILPFVAFVAIIVLTLDPPPHEEFEYEEATYYVADADVYAKFTFEKEDGGMKIMFSRDGEFEDTTNIDYVVLENGSWSEMLGAWHEGVTVQFDPYSNMIFTDNEGRLTLDENNKIDTTYCEKRSVKFNLRDTLSTYENFGQYYNEKLKYPYVSVRFTNVWGERGYVEIREDVEDYVYTHPNGDKKKKDDVLDYFKAQDVYGNNIKYKILTDSSIVVIRDAIHEELVRVEIPKSIEREGACYKVVGIDKDAFLRARKMEKIVLPDGLKWIEKGAFYECEALSKIEIPESVERVGTYAFGECKRLKTVSWSEQTQEIEDFVFVDCEVLESVGAWENIKKIGVGSFANCKRMEINNLPYTLGEIGDNAFCGCKAITSIIVPANVLRIGDRAFQNCENLEDIVLQEGLKEIGEGVFYQCDRLSTLVLPTTVEKIESGYMQAIDTLIVKREKPFEMNGWLNDKIEIYVPDSSMLRYKVHKDWRRYGVKGMSKL